MTAINFNFTAGGKFLILMIIKSFYQSHGNDTSFHTFHSICNEVCSLAKTESAEKSPRMHLPWSIIQRSPRSSKHPKLENPPRTVDIDTFPISFRKQKQQNSFFNPKKLSG